jgi:hypothetical protein
MHYEDTQLPGGIKRTYYFTSDEFVNMLCPEPPKISKEELLEKYKLLVDKTPDKFLKQHLDWSIKEENFELAAYIRDVAEARGVVINNLGGAL